MCRPGRHRDPLLLLARDAFAVPPGEDEARKRRAAATARPYTVGLGGPSLPATLRTVAFYVGLVFLVERLTLLAVERVAGLSPVLADARNRAVLARHVGADFVSLAACAWLAIAERAECADLLRHLRSLIQSRGRDGGGGLRDADWEDRIFAYRPGAQQLMVVFFVYQVKNMYDSLYWGDGVAFLLHHVFAGAAAWGGMYPGCCHYYAFFYFGFSEASTAILSLLANFDPDFGLVGLDAAFPATKVVLATLFVASFVVCRVLMWPVVSYHFFRDARTALRSDHPLAAGRRGYLRTIMACCAGLSLIQLVFVAMIVEHGKAEYAKLMHS